MEKPKQETIEEVAEHYQELFNFFSQEHNLILLHEEMDEIVYECDQFKAKFNKLVKHQSEKMFSYEYMLDFSWFLTQNIGQYPCDKTAHFKGEYLKQFLQHKKH